MCVENSPIWVLLDILMPGGIDGVETLTRLRQIKPQLSVVMMSAQKEIETAVKTMELGAKRYLTKPASIDEIVYAIEPFLELSRLSQENQALREQIGTQDEMVGERRCDAATPISS